MTSALVSSSTYGSACVIREVAVRAVWERLYRLVPMPHMVQAWVYGEAKAAEGWGVEHLVFEQHGRPQAICQVLVKRVLGLPVAARINRGPLFLAARPSDADGRAVYAALRQRSRFGRRGVLLKAPGLHDQFSGARTPVAFPYPFGVGGKRLDLANYPLFHRFCHPRAGL